MKSRFECRVRHLTVSFHVKRKRERLLDLPDLLDALSGSDARLKPHSMDGRHFLCLEEMQIATDRRTATLLISCSDKDGRDAIFADLSTFKRRRLKKRDGEGVGSSAHPVIALAHEPTAPMLHPAVLEEASGLNRDRVEKFLNELAAIHIPDAITIPARAATPAKKQKDEIARIRFDIHNDRALRDQVDAVRLREIVVVGNEAMDPDFHMTEAQILRFKILGSEGALSRADAKIARVRERVAAWLPGSHRMVMHLDRADGHGTTVRVDSETDDPFAEAFQRIDTLTNFQNPLEDAAEHIVVEIEREMVSVLKSRLADEADNVEAAGGVTDAHEKAESAFQPA
jgi:hypothetical protein